ncbi:hypothetical protein CBM2621_B120034 [Cupriavidus taiwanensis]|nr:hypothetical protein CBM2621_B120034 [Cupriavidus taiwanensis]
MNVPLSSAIIETLNKAIECTNFTSSE